MNKDFQDLIVGFVLFFLSLLFMLTMHNFVFGGFETKIGSLFFPKFVIFIILILSTILVSIGFLKAIKKDFATTFKSDEQKLYEEMSISEENSLNVLIYILFLFLYILLLYFLGFLLSTPLIIFFVMLILRGHNFTIMISISILVSFVIYYLCYYLMRVMLPTGVIFD
jgi:hypothetical protein